MGKKPDFSIGIWKEDPPLQGLHLRFTEKAEEKGLYRITTDYRSQTHEEVVKLISEWADRWFQKV